MSVAMMPLIRTSIATPRAAAEGLMSLNLPRDVLWTGLALVAVINTFLVYFVVGTSASAAIPIPTYFNSPLTLFVLIGGLTVVYIYAVYWAGHAIGGEGDFADILAVIVWFQVLRAIAQVAVIVLSLAIPPVGALLSLAVAVWGFWIFLNFLAAALNLNSPWHSLAVLVVAFVGLVLGVGLLTGLVGGIS